MTRNTYRSAVAFILMAVVLALPAHAPSHEAPGEFGVTVGELAAIKAEQARLVAQVDELRAQVARLNTELGLGGKPQEG